MALMHHRVLVEIQLVEFELVELKPAGLELAVLQLAVERNLDEYSMAARVLVLEARPASHALALSLLEILGKAVAMVSTIVSTLVIRLEGDEGQPLKWVLHGLP